MFSFCSQQVSQLHVYTCVFFSIMTYCRILITGPYAIQGTSLFIHSAYDSLHLLPPDSQSDPRLSPLPFDNHKAAL